MRVEENRLTSAETRKTLLNESRAIDEEIDKQSKIILDFKIQNNYVFMSTKSEYDKQYIAELFAKANQKQFELDVLKPKVAKLAESDNQDNKNFTLVIDALMSNPNSSTSGFLLTDITEWKSRQVTMSGLKAEYDILLKKYRPAHPAMQELQKQIDIVATELTAYRDSIMIIITSRLETIESERSS